MKHLFTLFVLLICFFTTLQAQEVPHHISNGAIYEFIDELANKGLVTLNTTIKPYSRRTIALALKQADGHPELSKRQQQEVTFYRKDFNKELLVGKDFDKRFDVFYHSDSLFKITINPILGGQFFNNGDKTVYHRWGGAEFYGSVGKHLAIYGSLRDNHESRYLGGPEYISKRPGAVYKGDDLNKDYSEARGGIVYSWKWGSLGLHKDNPVWGSGYSDAVILSGRAPSYGYLSFKMQPVEWFEFNYMHGWLVSEVVDSSRTYRVYNGDREVYANKFIAANMFTVKPWKKLNISFGNSIIYGDTDFNPAYLVPFLFFKSVDHTYNSWDNWVGHNAQMFIDISSRQIKGLHLYTSFFIDEIAISDMFNPATHSNDFAFKVGAKSNDLLPNLMLNAEYTLVRPLTYEHFIPTVDFESNLYGLGTYMGGNAAELFLSCAYAPIRGLRLQLDYTHLKKGKDYQQIFDDGEVALHPEINPDQEEIRRGLPFMNEVRYKNASITFKAAYQIINDGFIFVEATRNSFDGPDKEIYSNPYYLSGDNILSFGMNFGF
ncbi:MULTISPECIES: hypothetical protein [unclassified Carboxylicivirga]|uniref:hypothetical protein n=1 Tax=Carboxylicivirga TaxID=1628153 RepID=UPI003D3455E8